MSVEATDKNSFRLKGVVNFNNAYTVRVAVEQFIKQHKKGVCFIDFSKVPNTKSVILSLLVCWARLAQEHDTRLRFVNLTDKIRELIEISNLQAVFDGQIESVEK